MGPNQFQGLDKVYSFPTSIYLLLLNGYNSGNLISKIGSDLEFEFLAIFLYLERAARGVLTGPSRPDRTGPNARLQSSQPD
jgi:hypothetical protein